MLDSKLDVLGAADTRALGSDGFRVGSLTSPLTTRSAILVPFSSFVLDETWLASIASTPYTADLVPEGMKQGLSKVKFPPLFSKPNNLGCYDGHYKRGSSKGLY